MPISLVASTSKGQNFWPVTTDAIDTTGANLMTMVVSCYASEPTISDSKGNTWSNVVANQYYGAVGMATKYCASPTVGTGHTVTSNFVNYVFIVVAAFSGAKGTSPLDQTAAAGASSGATSQAAGSITPSEDNCLVVSYLGIDGGSSLPTIGSSYTRIASAYNTGNEGGGFGYIVQTTAGATNPSWSWSGACGATAVSASFKAAAATGRLFLASKLAGLGAGGPFYRHALG